MSILRAAAVLTCVAAPPPADAFRPPYVGGGGPPRREADLHRERLLALAPVPGTPPAQEIADYLARPWLDHVSDWMARYTAPTENQPEYGREFARVVSMAALMANLDLPWEEKRPIVVGLVQLGIDLQGLRVAGQVWNGGGGISSGRKFPILFAGLLLGDPAMQRFDDPLRFQEDTQTYYGHGWTGATALWQLVRHGGLHEPYEQKPPDAWSDADRRAESYRRCCTSGAWVGYALSALLMRGRAAWNHDAFFDYVDRWMGEDDTAALARYGLSYRPPFQQGQAWDPFVTAMWRRYRGAVPEQPRGRVDVAWSFDPATGRERAVPNPRPR